MLPALGDSLLANAQASYAMLGAAAIITFWVIRRLARRYRRMAHSKPKRILDSPSAGSASWSQLQADAYDMVRDFKGELDAKTRALQILIATAEQRAERLERAIEQASQLEREEFDREERPAASNASPDEPWLRRAYRLFDQGHSAAEISDRTYRPLGDVELALSLRPTPCGKSRRDSI